MAALRKKIDRQLIIWVAVAAFAGMLAVIVMVKGGDLGQSEVNARLAKEKAEAQAKAYQAKIPNPEASTQEAFARARQVVEQTAPSSGASSATGAPAIPPAPPASIPLPPVSEMDLERYKRAQAAIMAGASSSGSGSGVHDRGANSFVVYEASQGSASGDGAKSRGVLSVLDFSKEAPSRQGEDQVALEAAKQQEQIKNDPALIQAQKQLADAKALQAQQAAIARAVQAQSGVGDQNAKWLFREQNEAVKSTQGNIVATRNTALYWIAPGTAIPAVLLNAVNTLLPGTLTARVTQNIYDSRYGKYLVIPAGSVLVGKYNSSVQDGQNRVLMVFDTLVTPSGGEVALGNMSASDALGRAGLEGDLHTHFWERMGISTLLALEAVGMDKLAPQATTSGIGGTTTSPVANGAQIIVNTANQELQQRYSVKPNITLPAGQPMTIITTGGIEVPPIANTR